jgi:curved DNA-binding protein CbpA
MSHYVTLGISRTATKDQIRKAYLGLAKKFHPDVSKDPASLAKFQKIQEAYQFLSDDSKRQSYDQQDTSGQTTSSTSQNTWRREEPSPYENREPKFTEYAGYPGSAKSFARFAQRMHQMEMEREYQEFTDRMHRETRNMQFDQHPIFELKPWVWPLIFPFLGFALFLFYIKFSQNTEKFRVFWDSHGRAYVEDAFGEVSRFEPWDKKD